MVNYLYRLRTFNRDVRLFLVANVLLGFTYFGIYALLLNLYLHRLGYDAKFVGLVNAVGPLAFAVCSLPAGVLSQRWRSRRALMVGFTLETLGFGLLPVGEFMPSPWRAGWLLASYMLSWAGATFFVVNTGPFLMGATTQPARTYAFSVQAASSTVAAFIDNLLGGLLPGFFAARLGLSLAQPAPYRYPLWLASVLLFPAVFAMWATRETSGEQTPVNGATADRAPYPLILVIALITLIQTAGGWIIRIFFNVYLDGELHVPTALIGGLAAASQLLGVVALVAPVVIARWGKRRMIGWGTVGIAGTLLLLVFIAHWLAAGLAFMGVIALSSLTGPAFAVFSQELVPPGWRTSMAGAVTMAIGVGIAAVALGGGYLIAIWGYRLLFLAGVGLNLAGSLLFFTYFRKRRGAWVDEPIPQAVVNVR